MTRKLTVDGMGCEGCEDIVGNALSAVEGVEATSVDYEEATASVEGEASLEDLLEAVEFAGYEGDLAEG